LPPAWFATASIPRLWFDVALLSVETIIDGSRELRAFATRYRVGPGVGRRLTR